MKPNFLASIVTIASLAVIPSQTVAQTAAGAQKPQTDLSAKEATTRIDLAARQRMLLERMAKSICYAREGIHLWDNELYLQSAYISFEIAHRGIAEGDAKLGITGETNRNFRETRRELDLAWVTLSRLYDRFVDEDEISEQDFKNVMALTTKAHEHSNEIVVQMRSNYARFIGDRGFGDSILLDLYSKQKELTQELSKNVCLVARGANPEQSRDDLNSTLSRFQASLDGFRSGIPTLGIPKPPTDRIATQLQRTSDRWDEVRQYAETVAKGENLTEKELSDLEFGIDEVLREVDRVVFLLVDHVAKSQ